MSNRFFFSNAGKWDVGAVASRLKDAWFSGTVNARNGAFAGDVTMASLNGSALAGFRNRIINGDMRIDQRNNGAAQNAIAAGAILYPVDKTAVFASTQAGKLNIGRNLDAGPLPAGYTHYLGVTVGTAMAAFAAGEQNIVYHGIEGFNFSDFGWGTSAAKPVALSFLVYSSLTGLLTGSLRTTTRSYPFQFNVSTANTWTAITVQIPGDTTGTWATDNTLGVNVVFDLGSGTSNRGSAGWQAGAINGVTGSVVVTQTLGAVFRVTGLQVEGGTVATSFERRNYGAEFTACQRYYQTINWLQGCVATAASQDTYSVENYSVPMRAVPTAVKTGGSFTNCTDPGTPTVTAASFLSFVRSSAAGAVFGNYTVLLNADF